MRLRFCELTTNQGGGAEERVEWREGAPRFERGEEWGHFEFGSTIVMLIPPGLFSLESQLVGTPLLLGEIIGRRLSGSAESEHSR